MKVGIATDHNGVLKKKELISYLKSIGYDIIDYSQNNTPTDDYPDYAFKVANDIINNKIDLGILMCGTGIGMSIAANKVKGIRCAHVSNIDEAKLSRGHNNANIIAFSYKNDIETLKCFSKTFLETDFFQDERHIRRLNKIEEYENNER